MVGKGSGTGGKATAGATGSVATLTAVEERAFGKRFRSMHESLNKNFRSNATKSKAWRIAQLKAFRRMVSENLDALAGAIEEDLGRPPTEAMAEVAILIREASGAIANVGRWMSAEHHWTHMLVAPAATEVRREPYGACLIVGPYNYPINLCLAPLVGCFAGGNVAMVKPSELSSASERILADLIPRYFHEDVCCVATGAVAESTFLLSLKWDFVFFTGSPRVGRVVAAACAKHVTPHVLELGGKAPCIVDRTASSLTEAARRIVWTKFFNAGQTCMAPDYVLCHRDVAESLCAKLLECVSAFYGEDPRASPDFARMVSPAHARAVMALLEGAGGRVLCGGLREADAEERYVPPTIVLDPSAGSALMASEVFGPVLPVLTFEDIDGAVETANAVDPSPLALYVFSGSAAVCEDVARRVQSGDVVFNDCWVHAGVDGIPFGGVGNSGSGAYHGRHSFDCFTYQRGYLKRHGLLDAAYLIPTPPSVCVRYPPDSRLRMQIFKLALLYLPDLPKIFCLRTLLIGLAVAAVLYASQAGLLQDGKDHVCAL